MITLNILGIVNLLLGTLTVLSQAFIALIVIFALVPGSRGTGIFRFFSRNGLKFAFYVALVATAGSLFYSLYAGFKPCDLCWYQRIFMYPQVLLLGIAFLRDDIGIIDYVFSLSISGFIISMYHNIIYYNKAATAVCSLGGSCTTQYFAAFNYVTIPMMSFTAFSLILLFLSLKRDFARKAGAI